MRNPFAQRMKVSQGALTALRHEKIGWDHDALTTTFMMHRAPRSKPFRKGDI
jgi:hypothetical protein